MASGGRRVGVLDYNPIILKKTKKAKCAPNHNNNTVALILFDGRKLFDRGHFSIRQSLGSNGGAAQCCSLTQSATNKYATNSNSCLERQRQMPPLAILPNVRFGCALVCVCALWAVCVRCSCGIEIGANNGAATAIQCENQIETKWKKKIKVFFIFGGGFGTRAWCRNLYVLCVMFGCQPACQLATEGQLVCSALDHLSVMDE